MQSDATHTHDSVSNLRNDKITLTLQYSEKKFIRDIVFRYYMVKSDGVICVPRDLVMDGISQKDGDNGNQPILHLTMY